MSHQILDKNQDAHNYVHTTFPSETPLAFLADKLVNEKEWPVTEYGGSQIDYGQALVESKALLDMPENRKSFEDWEGELGTKRAKKRMNEWHEKNIGIAAREADLMLVNKITHLGWVPDPKQKKILGVAALKGTFQIILQRQDGTTETLPAATDWVELNFKKEVIGAIQRTAYEAREILEFTAKDVPISLQRGYINVETSDVTCSPLDKRVINKLKFIHSKNVPTGALHRMNSCLLYTSPSPRDLSTSRMPSSA